MLFQRLVGASKNVETTSYILCKSILRLLGKVHEQFSLVRHNILDLISSLLLVRIVCWLILSNGKFSIWITHDYHRNNSIIRLIVLVKSTIFFFLCFEVSWDSNYTNDVVYKRIHHEFVRLCVFILYSFVSINCCHTASS